MKRLLCVIPLVTALLTGCSAETEEVFSETTTVAETTVYAENTDEWGVTLSAEYDPNTHTVSGSFFQWGERDITELMSGSWYEIERYDEENGWSKVPYSSEFDGMKIGWTSEGWVIPEYGQRTFEQELFLYDKLEAGKYRIAKSIFDLPKPENSRIYYAEFEVE